MDLVSRDEGPVTLKKSKPADSRLGHCNLNRRTADHVVSGRSAADRNRDGIPLNGLRKDQVHLLDTGETGRRARVIRLTDGLASE